MIRPRPAQIDGVALVVESDESFNPVDVGALEPDAFARRILSRTCVRSRRELRGVIAMNRWMIDALFSVTIRLATSR
jgi:hypothetical protein